MTRRQEMIRVEYLRFQAVLRMSRWAAIDAELQSEGMADLSSEERDEVDMCAATGMMPFDKPAWSEDPVDCWPQMEDNCIAPAVSRASRQRH